ncbi:MAG TPA: RNA polymerase sigma factor [Pyrinomonadaceae bacterium]|jgi:RNA polymerase sigma-70 factor (ECF subfamily)
MNNVKEHIENTSILQRIAQGDQSAVQDCLKQYGNLVWYLVRKFTGNAEDAEDAAQEIFIDIWRNAARFDAAKAPEAAFITMIARRRLIDQLRKRKRQSQLQPLEDFTFAAQTDAGSEMQILLDARRASQIIDGLRPERKKVINLAIFGGLSHLEIAERTGMPLGTVKTHIRRGFQKVRKSFGAKSEDLALV